MTFCASVPSRFASYAIAITVASAGVGNSLCRTAVAAERASILAALETITRDELQRHVDVLADDTFEGREAGSRGGHAAGNYLATFLKEHNLDGAGDRGSYFQAFGTDYRNILGLLPGSDPELSEEIILIGGHYDHVGYGNPSNSFGPTGYIHNGADDNASGVAGLLELIDAFGHLPQRPRRSILFALWDGEEKGLLGSQHWVAHPSVDLNRVVFAINVDMIGRLRERRVEVYGLRTGTGLRQLVSRANADADLTLQFSWEMKANSDHHSFFARNIPVVMLHTGLHDDYHRPADDAHKINSAGIREIGALLFQLANDVADQNEIPRFRRESHLETPQVQREFERPQAPPPPRLGISWDASAERVELKLTHVVPGSAAARGGLRVGDRIVAVSGQPLTGESAFRLLVATTAQPLRLDVVREGAVTPQPLSVPLDGQPVRVGMSWKPDAAEPAVHLVTQVVPGSPADQAGVRPGDRIYEVDGLRIEASDELRTYLQTASRQTEIVVERDGRLRRVTVVLDPIPPQA